MSQFSIVIVDAQPGQQLGSRLSKVFDLEETYRVQLTEQMSDLSEHLLEFSPEVLIPVLPSNLQAGKKLLSELRTLPVELFTLAVVRSESLGGLAESLRSVENEFVVSPFSDAEIRIRVERWAGSRAKPSACSPERAIADACALSQIVGQDQCMRDLKEKIRRAARFEFNVLVTGETGTGKERCAHALHYMSERARKPFVCVNCGAIPPDLFESELYGHERGAFTGAHAKRQGLVAAAEGGTLFLDEIEALSLACQVKLLRFLQDQEYFPVGSTKPKRANVRVVAASNMDLLERTKCGQFREDLFYRLAAITLRLPPLRDRREDIALLCAHFLKAHGARQRPANLTFSDATMQLLRAHRWPGNVRELENAILHAIVFSNGPEILPEDLPIPQCEKRESSEADSFQGSKAKAIEHFERAYVTELLQSHGGNVTHAARAANKDRRAFGRLVKKYVAEPS